jgi:hypothetical protein
MHGLQLAIFTSLLYCAVPHVHASETTPSEATPETQEPCDADSSEDCIAEEGEQEELERGFDPCLINSSLPACKSDIEGGDRDAVEKARSQAEEPDDSS